MSLTRCTALLLLVLGVAAIAAAEAPSPSTGAEETRWVFRVYYDQPEDIRALTDFDLWEFTDTVERFVLVMIDPAEYDELVAVGLPLELDVARTAEINAPREVSPAQRAGIPGYPCYRTVEETYATAQQIVLDHPGLATWIDVGDSWDMQDSGAGYDLMVLRLTNAAVAGPKPKIFITSSIHAREYPPAELMTRFGEYLADNHDVDADVTWLLDWHEVHLLLQANPDGRKKAETGLYWRKNTNQNYCSPTSNNRGADLNRNFEFEWGCCGGSSGAECHTLYRGPFAGSEPETQSVQDYLLAEFPDQRHAPLDSPAPDDATGVYMDIHSAGNLVLWPWGFDGNSPNLTSLQTLGRKLAHFNGYEPKQAVDLYPTDGTTIDFAYGELGVAAFVYETGTSFFQDCSTFENVIVPDNLPSLTYAAKVARTPYMTPAGPDALQVAASPGEVASGGTFDLTATLDDTRFNDQNGNEPTQAVVAAEYYVDLPPWAPGSPAPTGMFAVDGSFDSPVEAVTAVVGTLGLDLGRHIVFVRGLDAAGNRGVVGAAFFTVSVNPDDVDGDGVPNLIDCDPNDETLWAVPSPARELTVTKQPRNNLTWTEPLAPGAYIIRYQWLRSPAVDDFEIATCASTGETRMATDPSVPAGGEIHHYLVRSINGCGGNLGYDSAGVPRSGSECVP